MNWQYSLSWYKSNLKSNYGFFQSKAEDKHVPFRKCISNPISSSSPILIPFVAKRTSVVVVIYINVKSSISVFLTADLSIWKEMANSIHTKDENTLIIRLLVNVILWDQNLGLQFWEKHNVASNCNGYLIIIWCEHRKRKHIQGLCPFFRSKLNWCWH